MGMLDRYKKTGGFLQLVNLLETSSEAKQQKFLEIIRTEDPRWADAAEAKMLSLEKVLSWDDTALAVITGTMLEINVAAIVKSSNDAIRNRLYQSLAHQKRRKVEELVESSQSNPGEFATSVQKMLETVRQLSSKGILRIDKIDPLRHVDSDIEEKLAQGKDIPGVASYAESHAKALQNLQLQQAKEAGSRTPHLEVLRPGDPPPESAKLDLRLDSAQLSAGEFEALRRKIQSLTAENTALKNEIQILKSRLEQIRKLA